MSQLDDAHRHQGVMTEGAGRARPDWAVGIVMVAVGTTLVWVYLGLWAFVRAVQLVIS